MFETVVFNTAVVYFGTALAGLGCIVAGTSVYDAQEIKRQKQRRAHPYAKQYRHRPHITVVILARNQSYSIARCLDSVFKSSYRNKYDVIVLGYAEDDETKKIIQSYRAANPKKEITLVTNHKNIDAMKAIGLAVKNSLKSEMIFVLNPDHLLSKQTLKQISYHYQEAKLYNLILPVQIMPRPALKNLLDQYQSTFSTSLEKLKTALACESKNLATPFIYAPSQSGNKFLRGDLVLKPTKLIGDVQIYADVTNSIKPGVYTQKKRSSIQLNPESYKFNTNSRRYMGTLRRAISVTLYGVSHFLRLLTPFVVAYFIYLALNFNQTVWIALIWLIAATALLWSVTTNNQLTFKAKGRLSLYLPIMPGLLYILTAVNILAKLAYAVVSLVTMKPLVVKDLNKF